MMTCSRWVEIEALALYTFGPHRGGPDLVDPYERERQLLERMDDYRARRRFDAWLRNHGAAA